MGCVGVCADGGLADAAREHDVLYKGYSEAGGAVWWGHGVDEQYVCMVYMQVQQARGTVRGMHPQCRPRYFHGIVTRLMSDCLGLQSSN